MKAVLILALSAVSGCGLFSGSNDTLGSDTLATVPPRVVSPELAPFLPLVASTYPEVRGQRRLLYIYTAQADWRYRRHASSGAVMARTAEVAVGFRQGESCGVELFDLTQASTAPNSWSRPRITELHGARYRHWQRKSCEQVHETAQQIRGERLASAWAPPAP